MASGEANSAFRLDGKRALITGAGGGIGRALVEAFRQAGAEVIGCDRELALMEGLQCERRLAFDLTDAAATRAAIAKLEADGGAPDVLVSNAGGSRGETLDDIDDEVWAREIALNLTGAYNVSTPIIAGMMKRGGGAIVFIATVNGLAYFGNPAYTAAKAGLIGFAKSVAVERGKFGVRANVVCPGSVRTPAWDHRMARTPDLLNSMLPHYPLGRIVTPHEVAKAALFLCTDAASGITGAIVPVDAGLTAGDLIFVRDVIGRK